MKDILQDIVETKIVTVEQDKRARPISEIVASLSAMSFPERSMKRALAESQSGIIAEFKRRSPSLGWINQSADVRQVAAAYQAGGASAISVLTDTPYFGGTLDDLRVARQTVDIPILRKDFIVDEYQLYQAREVGADAVLLIAAVLDRKECGRLAGVARSLGLETLLEIHAESELDYVSDRIDMVGVNNRNLGTFHTDVEVSFRLAERLAKDSLLVSESGISRVKTVAELRRKGFRGFLIGENFIKREHPGSALEDFINELSQL